MHACLCSELQPVASRTRVIVLRHRKEIHRTSNTGRLVPLTLEDGHVRVVGGRGVKIAESDVADPTRRVLVLFPGPDSRPIDRSDDDPRPVTLLVPDSTWRRAFKMTTREPALSGIPRVHVPLGAPSQYRLRRHPDPRFLATFEAIARALGVLEGPELQQHLERRFELLVERTLASRGTHDR